MIDGITKENLSLELKTGVALLYGPATLTELSERMGMEKRIVSRAIDVLMDQGQIRDEWQKRDDGRHVKRIMLCDVARPFFEHINEKLWGKS